MTSGRGALLIATLALLWGSNFLWIKVALAAFSPIQLTAGRMVLGAVVLLAVVIASGQRLPCDLPTWGHLTVAALVANAAPYLLFALGETRVDSSIAGALNATTPLWTVALAFAARRADRLRVRQLAGLVLGFTGSLLIFTPWDADQVDTVGALYCLSAALCYAVSYLYMSRFLTPRALTPTVLSTGQLIAASVLTALALPVDPAATPVWLPGSWIALAVLGILGTGFAYVLNYSLVRTDGPVGASVVIYLLPVVAVALGAAASEPIAGWLVAGVAVILAGVLLSGRTRLPARG